ncbi:MAG: hypothetical protein COV55_04270 [Candidatus Komeilibacteria bacterium CG11_big_fil_rev_8_21_14_0_20_36_20]|uniref:Uncharacterized protein n=1 Tax=Candidatus Komeilibacteria bacterium CG11_big_fil_rev_8_21_14_0_20_36_20 TaxID=1974477 RepID=A0A2H0NBQ7_9BACT|nr:MAG: hypothetical protein COV55_04270 [Candidatus Komeilibacteria bacterium CG11_big_fil_rev_8_21_14_0_20_36_20]PIR81459.1 MAG: hypothetical protein COU21_03500 [Candidatus Komeilibacteria bacterium CG10_big_fil_rev_8_21_14_0_10_36_65]PJC55660.1 MAG: hypothetical protein CO027_00855 [Candidatus Komeilibacteria bacterium CG_4_9_14_0_2_um_filter_36_13]
MKFLVKDSKYNPVALMRFLGYHQERNGSFARRLSSARFPRLHVYLNEKNKVLEISLHLDQKGACYGGQTAHSGDYEGNILEQEKKRINKLLEN